MAALNFFIGTVVKRSLQALENLYGPAHAGDLIGAVMFTKAQR